MSSGTVVVRRVRAVPARTAGETWRVVAGLLCAPGTAAHDELLAAAGPAGMVIAEGTTRDAPIVVTADTGPRLRVYTLHGGQAGDGPEDESPLPALLGGAAGWSVSLPCHPDDLRDVAAALAGLPHVTAHDPAAGQAKVAAGGTPARSGRLVVDRSGLGAS